MHFKSLIPLFLMGGAVAEVANYQTNRAPLDGAAIAKFLGDLTTSFTSLDKLIAGITAENVGPQMDKITQESGKINAMLNKNAAKIKASKQLSGISDILPLISKVGPLVQTVNKTLQHIVEKRPIVNDAKMANKFKEGLYASEPGIVNIAVAIGGQISLPAPKATSAAAGAAATDAPAPKPQFKLTEENAKPIVDAILDGIVGVFDGSVDLSQIAGMLGKGKGKGKGGDVPGGIPGAAATMTAGGPAATPDAAPAAPAAPAATSAHTMPMPKASKGKGKGPGMRLAGDYVEFEA